jgi:ADP-ribose pyrophosphatase
MVKPWKRIRSTEIGDHRIFKIREDVSRSPRTGRDHRFTVLEARDWTNVIALTPRGEVVLIRQFRQGTGTVTLEIPGGEADPADLSIEDTARRELREETGYEAERMVTLGIVTPNPAFLDNRCHTFLAENARRTGTPRLDGTEDIDVELSPIDSIPGLIAAGEITHALVVAAFHLYDLHLRG